MYGRESKPCRVYEFGCLPPTAGEEEFLAEIRRRNDLWNKLVEIERAHREKVREILTLPDDPIPALYEKLRETRDAIKSARKRKRSGKADISVLQERVRELKEQIAALREERARIRKAQAEANRTLLDQLEVERREAVKAAAKSAGLYWVNWEEVKNAYEIARRRAMREKAELRFRRFTGAGKVTVRYQHGLPVPDAFGADTRLQIEPVDPVAAWQHPVRSVRRKASRTKIRLRITSNKNRQPVWIELPLVMHRPLPDGEIRTASVIREKVGRKWRYKAVITVALAEGAPRPAGPKDGVVAVDLGWRMVADGLRVAYWEDGQGNHGQFVLPNDVLYEFKKYQDLRSIRDKHFNEIKAELSGWAAKTATPDWLTEKLKTLAAWRSPGRMVTLLVWWAENRFAGDETIWEHLQEWRRQENHLYGWEVNLRDQAHRRRREEYRKFAVELARKYKTVVLERFDLRRVARKPDAEDGTRGSKPADWQRVVASASTLRGAIENACGRLGVDVVRVDAKFTTMECAECGHTEKFDAARQIWRTCPACGALWDQDRNAARVLLKRVFANKVENQAETSCSELGG